MGEYQSDSKQGTDMIEQNSFPINFKFMLTKPWCTKSCTLLYLLSLPQAQNPFYMKETRYCSN